MLAGIVEGLQAREGDQVISERLRAKAWAIGVAASTEPLLTRKLPLKLRSRANEAIATRRGRRGQAARSKAQRSAARMAIAGLRLDLLDLQRRTVERTIVRLVRVSTRELDDDNLAGALKAVRDGVADALKVNDRDPRVVWLPDWEQGKKHEVRIEVYRER